MKTKDLIKELQALDPEGELEVTDGCAPISLVDRIVI